MDDDVDRVDVEPAGRDVGRHHRVQRALGEVGERALALGLAEVTVDRARRHALDRELLDEAVRAALCTHEDEDLVVRAADGRGHLHLVHLVDLEVVVHHLGNCLCVACDLVEDGIAEVALHQAVDGAVEGRGEQEGLVDASDEPAQHPLDLGHEAHVGHPVGLVEHEHVEVLDGELAAVAEIDQPTRGRDDDLAALAELTGLTLDVRAAVDRDDSHAEVLGERAQHVVDLHRELASRQQDEAARTRGVALLADHLAVGSRELAHEALQHRQAKRERFARAGLGLAAHVTALQGVGDREGLDREGGDDPLVGERLAELLVDAQGFEGLVRRVLLRDGFGSCKCLKGLWHCHTQFVGLSGPT